MILDHEFPPDIRVENEIEALTSKGHHIHIACYTFSDANAEERTNSVSIHRKKISKFIYKSSVGVLKFPFYFNFWRTYLNQLFIKNKFDAIHVHDLPLASIGYEFASKYNIPFTLDLHENWPALLNISTHTKSFLGKLLSSDSQWKKYEIEYCKKADHVIVVVNEAKTRLIKLGINPDKIKVVSNTLNFSHFELPTTQPDDNFFSMLYAGGITKHRGLQYVIKGMKHIRETDKAIRLWVLGSGSYTEHLKELAKSEGVEEQVLFPGWKSYKEMQEYFGKADVCLIPHVKSDHTDSTIPHKLFQYMYAGKPIIVSDCAPIERIVNETKSGLIYRYDNPKEFAEKVNVFIDRKNEYSAERGTHAVNEKYNWTKDSQILTSIYKN